MTRREWVALSASGALAIGTGSQSALAVDTATLRYITGDSSGWLRVKLANNSIIALPQFLTVSFLRTEGDRDYFTILEGPYLNQQASVQRNGTSSWLRSGDARLAAATLIFRISKQQLWIADQTPMRATTDPTNPMPVGIHDLEIPDFPHSLGSPYLSQTPYATTWFRAGHFGDRYLHPGRISAGCITVLDIPMWTAMYNYLIRRRKRDGRSVGTVWVVRPNTWTSLDVNYPSGSAGTSVTIQASLKMIEGQQSAALPQSTVRLYFREYQTNNYTRVHRADGKTDMKGVVKFTVTTPSIPSRVHGYDLVYEGDSETRNCYASCRVSSTS